MVNGYQQTCIVVAAIQVGVFDRLASSPATIDVLARDLGAHAGALGRLVRALVVLGLVDDKDGTIHLASAGKLLLEGGLGAGIRAWALLVGGEYLAAWGNLQHSVKTGEVAFDHVFGTSAWRHREANPTLNEAFNRVTSGEQLRAIAGILRAYDFSPYTQVVDVGGGHGHLVAGIVQKHANLRGIVFDQPHVASAAGAALARANVAGRCEVVTGSFFDGVPPGGDCYVMKHVLHNWEDPDCVKILTRCREAMKPGAKLLVLENVLPDDPKAAEPLVMLDLHMLAVLGGRERTSAQYAALLAAAGLRHTRTIATREGAPDIVEAELP
jgi:hypothetical protein